MRAPRTCGRPGFGLAELVVAALLFSVGLLTLCGAAAFAAARLRTAALENDATRLAATIIDSLRAAPRPAAGTLERPGIHAAWTAGTDGIILRVTFSPVARLHARVYHAPTHTFDPLPALFGGPSPDTTAASP